MGLVVSGLTKRYGEKTVVDHLSFEISHPGVYALLGTNGAGKTTTLRMMLGILAKDEGEVLWNGKPFSVDRCSVGYLAEERGLYPKYGLMDQLLYFASLRGVTRQEARRRIKILAEKLEVEEYLYPDQDRSGKKTTGKTARDDRETTGKAARGGRGGKAGKPKLADQLSKGNQQKIQLMAALLPDPDLLILDEPLSGLDPVNTDLFKGMIREEIQKGKYLIMSSHQMATVEEFCTDLTILHHARPVLQGNLNEIKKSYGRVNLKLKTEQSVDDYLGRAGVMVLSEKEFEYQIKVTGEEQANRLLRMLVEDGIPVVTFELREPSLHEIFVEKVGHEHE